MTLVAIDDHHYARWGDQGTTHWSNWIISRVAWQVAPSCWNHNSWMSIPLKRSHKKSLIIVRSINCHSLSCQIFKNIRADDATRTKLSLVLDTFPFLESCEDFLTPRHGSSAYSQIYLSGSAPCHWRWFSLQSRRLPVVFLEIRQQNIASSRDRPLSAPPLTELWKGGNGDHTGEFSVLKNILCPIPGNGEEPISLN